MGQSRGVHYGEANCSFAAGSQGCLKTAPLIRLIPQLTSAVEHQSAHSETLTEGLINIGLLGVKLKEGEDSDEQGAPQV